MCQTGTVKLKRGLNGSGALFAKMLACVQSSGDKSSQSFVLSRVGEARRDAKLFVPVARNEFAHGER